MTYRWLDDLDVALTAGGVAFTPVGPSSLDPTWAADWRSRGRPSSTGEFDVSGVLCHHTASPAGTSDQADLNAILCGNSQAPGPISQILIGRSGTVYLVAAGRANHGGQGIRPGIDSGCFDMNSATIGIEASNNGVGEAWPEVQIEAYLAVVAALIAHYGWGVDRVWLHATTGPPYGGCNSKIDPAGPWRDEPTLTSQTWNLATWRDAIADQGGPGPVPTGDDAVLTILQCTDAYAAFLGFTWHGLAQTVEWLTNDGLHLYESLGCPTQAITVEQCSGMTLMGPLPEGDRRTWTGAEFRRVIS